VIYLTGYTQDMRLRQATYLSKPVVEKELAALMEKILCQTR
jgi:hypothetical protein